MTSTPPSGPASSSPSSGPAASPPSGPASPYPPPNKAPVPPQPPRPIGPFRWGFGLGTGATLGAGLVLTVVGIMGSVLVGLVLAGIVGAAMGAAGGNPNEPVTTTVWGKPDADGRLVALQVTGVIMGDSSDGGAFVTGTYGYKVAEAIDSLEKDDADGLILEMNTPGGTIYGSRAIADAVERYQKRTGHTVMAYVKGMSASGGMYAMSGADEIVADHGTLVGSIGVIMGPFQRFRDVTALQESLLTPGVEAPGGITEEYLTRGKGKDFGNPFRDMTAEERAVMETGLEQEYTGFVDWVSEQRGIPAQTIRDDLGAYIYDPETAISKGLVDRVLGRDEGYRHAAEMNGLDPDNTRVDRVRSEDFLSLLLGSESKSEAAGALCTGPATVLAFSGDLASVCGR